MRLHCNVCGELIPKNFAIRNKDSFVCVRCWRDLDENGNFPEEVEGDIDDRCERIKTRN
jgi:hypothetical protein